MQFACMGFRDYKANAKTAFELTDFQENPRLLVNWLNTVRSHGGGSNFGESALSAMVYGVQSVEWPDVKRRVIALFTDDKPHLNDYLVDGWDGAKRIIADADIEQIHLFTVNKKIDSYDEMDDHEYVVFLTQLAEDAIDDMVDEDLEMAMREFVKVSSSGNFGAGEIILEMMMISTSIHLILMMMTTTFQNPQWIQRHLQKTQPLQICQWKNSTAGMIWTDVEFQVEVTLKN